MKEKIEVNMAWYFLLLIIVTFLTPLFIISVNESTKNRKDIMELEKRIEEQSMLIEYLEKSEKVENE